MHIVFFQISLWTVKPSSTWETPWYYLPIPSKDVLWTILYMLNRARQCLLKAGSLKVDREGLCKSDTWTYLSESLQAAKRKSFFRRKRTQNQFSESLLSLDDFLFMCYVCTSLTNFRRMWLMSPSPPAIATRTARGLSCSFTRDTSFVSTSLTSEARHAYHHRGG